jgi:hypothetical protein
MAVEQAVKAVLAEVLTNPDLLATLRAAVAEATPGGLQKDQPQESRVRACLSRVWSWISSTVRACFLACGRGLHKARQGLATAWAKVQVVRRFKYPLLAAVGFGGLVAVGVYFSGPYVAALAGWVAGFTTSLSVQAGIWMRRFMGSVRTDCT